MLNGQVNAKCLRVSNANLVCFMAGQTRSSVNINILRFVVFCTGSSLSNDVCVSCSPVHPQPPAASRSKRRLASFLSTGTSPTSSIERRWWCFSKATRCLWQHAYTRWSWIFDSIAISSLACGIWYVSGVWCILYSSTRREDYYYGKTEPFHLKGNVSL